MYHPITLFSALRLSVRQFQLPLQGFSFQKTLATFGGIIIKQQNHFFKIWLRLVVSVDLPSIFFGIPVAGHSKICPGFLFHCPRKTANLIDNEIHVTAETIFISKHSARLARRGKTKKVRHFRRCSDFL